MEVAQLVKFVPYLHEDQCLALEPTKKKKKPCVVVGTYITNVGEKERAGSLGLAGWPPTPTWWVTGPVLKQSKQKNQNKVCL